MKTFFELREGYESSRIKKTAMKSLSHGAGTKHNGHDGMASYHASMADKYKGTEAGKHHQRASDHHVRAVNAIRKGNINGGLTHAKNALDAAKSAHNSHNSRHSEAGKSGSMALYYDHESTTGQHKQAQRRDKEYNQKDKPTRSDKPIQRAIGKAKTKIKRVLRNEATSPADLAKAMAAYKAKGGKVTKAPAAKAQGYHGRDDPGKGMHGMLDKGDTKKSVMGTRKKVKSMSSDMNSENYVSQEYKNGKKTNVRRVFRDLKSATAHASKMGGDHRVHKEAKRTVTIDRPDRLTSLRVSKDKPPFDNPKPIQKNTKDKFGNPIKNRAKHLARKAARDLLNKAK
jgi:hypothetical protein